MVTYILGCADSEMCQCDLSLKVSSQQQPTTQLIAGEDSHIDFDVTIENIKKEPAFGVDLKISSPNIALPLDTFADLSNCKKEPVSKL